MKKLFRDLTPIEITEGALLADVAVVFQCIATFLPFGSSFFTLLCFVVFSVLTLRRGLYVSLMGGCVGLFLLCILIGPQSVFLFCIEGSGGIFLGLAMKYRLPHLLLLLLGILSGATFLYVFLLGAIAFAGLHISTFVETFHRMYSFVIRFMNIISMKMGFFNQWHQNWNPHVDVIANDLFIHWWLALYLFLLTVISPVVCCIYVATNAFVRLLGYEVRPFPDGRMARRVQRLRRRLFKYIVKSRRGRKLWIKG